MFLPLLLAAAPFAAVEAHIELDGVAVNDITEVVIELSDESGIVMLEHTAEGAVIVDGAVVINDLDLGALPPAALDAPLFFRVIAFGLTTSRAPVPTVPNAALSVESDEASFATAATSLGGVPAGAYASVSDLSADSGLGIPFANLIDVPSSIADGVDEGTARSLDATLAISGGQIVIASGSLRGQHFAPAAIGTTALQNGAVTSAKLGAVSLTATHLASASIVAADFATASIGKDKVSGGEVPLFRVTAAACEVVNLVTTDTVCTKRGGCGFGQARDCATGVCVSSFVQTCANTLVANLIVP